MTGAGRSRGAPSPPPRARRRGRRGWVGAGGVALAALALGACRASGPAAPRASDPAARPGPAEVDAVVAPIASAITARYGPAKPVLRVGALSNDTRRSYDTDQLKHLVYEALQVRDVVRFSASAADLQLLGEGERAGRPPAAEPPAATDLLLSGSLADEVIARPTSRATRFTLTLRLFALEGEEELCAARHSWQLEEVPR